MVKTLSIIGRAGDIDKSYVTMALADFLSGAANKRVLAIDVGGQGQTTSMLIGDQGLDDINDRNTVARLIWDRMDPEDERFNFDAMVLRGVSNVRQASTVDLLPSSRFDYSSNGSSGPDSAHPTDLLWRVVRPHLEKYDVVLVDCGREGGILMRNALHTSDGYILLGESTFNMLTGTTRVLEMPEIILAVQRFNKEMDRRLKLYGMVVSGYVRSRRRVVEEQLLGIGAWGGFYWSPVALLPSMYMSPPTVAAGQYPLPDREHNTLRQKWGHKFAKVYRKFAKDILQFEGCDL